ncbi:boron transporter 1 [Ectocarpus siliculosus]|uniref:Boron transporter 1 n=1 Tax=Ectocarpus siliculosus TaxID=2880 RepID=D7FMX9_ECTSI|nr:boron transporter 1 [Ectocarpus siliculosus]|eukprot:CBJ30043.1 boron transporter 1 [Ectocarpus siliculosus]
MSKQAPTAGPALGTAVAMMALAVSCPMVEAFSLSTPSSFVRSSVTGSTRTAVRGLGPVSMSSRLRNDDKEGNTGAYGKAAWSGADQNQRSKEAAVGEVSMSSRLREDESRPKPFYGKVAWTGVHNRRAADAAAPETGPSLLSPHAGGGGERKQDQRTKLKYEKAAWTWSDRRENFSAGLGAGSPVSSSPLLRDEEAPTGRSYSKVAWSVEQRGARSSRPLAQTASASGAPRSQNDNFASKAASSDVDVGGLVEGLVNEIKEEEFKVEAVPPAQPRTPTPSVQSYINKPKIKLVEGFGKGLLADIKGKAPFLKSDITDGFSIKVLSTIFFLFFACLAPAVAFGGMLGVATAGAMGTIEMIAATAVCGMVYAALAGQPLTIIGSTGPVLAFIAVLYKTAARMSLPFLPLYTWVGFWTAGMLGVASAFSLSNMVLFFTRFTDEIFSLLISVIFIMEATKDITGVFASAGVPLVAATSTLVVALSTYGVATILKSLRRTQFLNKPIREFIADFAPTLGVATGTLAAMWGKSRYALALPTLTVPSALTTTVGRPWLVPFMTLPVWARWAAFFPALMSTVLLFMDQNITVRLVNAKQHKLKKGYGMNLDMGIIAGLTAACSVFGLPWLVAATVRSLAHVKSLTKYDQLGWGRGERIAGVAEQRVSGIAIHGLIGVAILKLRPLLAQIPLPVTTGLFLYLGVTGLAGNEMWDRTKLLFTDPKLRPKAAPWSRLPASKTNMYTMIQLACLGSMMWVKGSPIGVLFPVLIALLAPLRMLLVKTPLFTEGDLSVLDSEG